MQHDFYPIGSKGVALARTQASDAGAMPHVICVVDASYSMGQHYAYAAREVNALCRRLPRTEVVVFGRDARALSHSAMSPDLGTSGVSGAGTDILAVVTLLKNRIRALRALGVAEITVVFVSDGDDTCNRRTFASAIRTIGAGFDSTGLEMFCVGVGSSFPTDVVARQLHAAFHSGRRDIPIVFLVRAKEEFAAAFAAIEERIPRAPHAALPYAARLTPWSPSASGCVVRSGAYFIVDNALQAAAAAMAPIESGSGADSTLGNANCRILSCAVIEEAATQWTALLQNRAVQAKTVAATQGRAAADALKAELRGHAQQALEFVKSAWDALTADPASTAQRARKSVYARVIAKTLRRENYVYLALVKELTALAAGEFLDGLSDVALAQRMAIGSHTGGKYHDRARALRGVSNAEFAKHREQFVAAVERAQLEAAGAPLPPDSLVSVVSLDSLGDLLAQTDLAKAVKMCESIYEVIQTLPLVGVPVMMSRPDGLIMNPWLGAVQAVCAIHPAADTLALIEGGADADTPGAAPEAACATMRVLEFGRDERANCVIPLYDFSETEGCVPTGFAADPRVQDVVRTQLYQQLATYALTGNADVLLYDAHLAQLASLHAYWLVQPPSAKRAEMLRLCAGNARLFYGQRPTVRAYVAALAEQPRLAMVTAAPGSALTCPAITKPLLLIAAYHDRGLFDAQVAEALVHAMREGFARVLTPETRDYARWFALKPEPLAAALDSWQCTLADVAPRAAPGDHFTLASYLRAVKAAFAEEKTARPMDPELVAQACAELGAADVPGGQYAAAMRVCAMARALASELLGEAAGAAMDDSFIQLVAFACDYSASGDRAAAAFPTHEEAAARAAECLMNAAAARHYAAAAEAIEVEAAQTYRAWYLETHSVPVLPLSWAEIRAYYAAKGWPAPSPASDRSGLAYNPDTGLCGHACQAPKCPFYLAHSTVGLNAHWQPCIDAELFVRAFHKTIRLHCDRAPEDILELVIAKPALVGLGNGSVKPDNPAHIRAAAGRHLADICAISAKYRAMGSAE